MIIPYASRGAIPKLNALIRGEAVALAQEQYLAFMLQCYPGEPAAWDDLEETAAEHAIHAQITLLCDLSRPASMDAAGRRMAGLLLDASWGMVEGVNFHMSWRSYLEVNIRTTLLRGPPLEILCGTRFASRWPGTLAEYDARCRTHGGPHSPCGPATKGPRWAPVWRTRCVRLSLQRAPPKWHPPRFRVATPLGTLAHPVSCCASSVSHPPSWHSDVIQHPATRTARSTRSIQMRKKND